MKKAIIDNLNIIRVFPSLLYLLMYVPIWRTKHLVLYNNVYVIALFTFMCIMFLLGLLGIISNFIKLPIKLHFIKYLPCITCFFATPFFLFDLYFFILNYFNIPFMPTPGS